MQFILSLKSRITEKRIKTGIRYVLGGVFIVSGAMKLFDHSLLLQQLNGFLPFGYTGLEASAYGLIIAELALGTFLLFRPSRNVIFASIGALSVFCLFLTYKIITHDPSLCGCIGNFLLASNHQQLTQDLVLLLGAVYLS